MRDLWIGAMEGGGLKDVPFYDEERHGRNWVARVWDDPASTGGLGFEIAKPTWEYGLSVIPRAWGRGTVIGLQGWNYVFDKIWHHRGIGVIISHTEDALAVILYKRHAQALRAAAAGMELDRLLRQGYLDVLGRKVRAYGDKNVSGPKRALLDALVDEIKQKHPEKYMEWWCGQDEEV